jgi:hypothetical protein
MSKRGYVKENVFSYPYTEEALYWAGFLAADGTVSKKSRIGLELAYADFDHLLKFRDFVQAENEVEDYYRTVKGTECHVCRLRFTSYQISKDLRKFNIIPRKTYNYTFPEHIRTYADPCKKFILGYMDGDGSVNRYYMSLLGRPLFIKEVMAVFNEFTSADVASDFKIRSVGEYTDSLCVGKKSKQIVLAWLYSNSDGVPYLTRKYDIFKLHYFQ